MIITMLHGLHSYSYNLDLAMHSRPLDSILATEMIILLCSHIIILNILLSAVEFLLQAF